MLSRLKVDLNFPNFFFSHNLHLKQNLILKKTVQLSFKKISYKEIWKKKNCKMQKKSDIFNLSKCKCSKRKLFFRKIFAFQIISSLQNFFFPFSLFLYDEFFFQTLIFVELPFSCQEGDTRKTYLLRSDIGRLKLYNHDSMMIIWINYGNLFLCLVRNLKITQINISLKKATEIVSKYI